MFDAAFHLLLPPLTLLPNIFPLNLICFPPPYPPQGPNFLSLPCLLYPFFSTSHSASSVLFLLAPSFLPSTLSSLFASAITFTCFIIISLLSLHPRPYSLISYHFHLFPPPVFSLYLLLSPLTEFHVTLITCFPSLFLLFSFTLVSVNSSLSHLYLPFHKR